MVRFAVGVEGGGWYLVSVFGLIFPGFSRLGGGERGLVFGGEGGCNFHGEAYQLEPASNLVRQFLDLFAWRVFA